MVDVIFESVTSDGEYICAFPSFQRSKPVTLYVYGNIDGAFVYVYVSPDGENWFPAKYSSGTAISVIDDDLLISEPSAVIVVGSFTHMKLEVAYVGEGTSINAVVM